MCIFFTQGENGAYMKNTSSKMKLNPGLKSKLKPVVKTAVKLKNQRAELKKAPAQTLKDSKFIYRSLFENMLNGLAYCRMIFEKGQPQDFIYLDVNNTFESLTGLKDVVGKKVSEVVPGIRETDPGLFEIYGRVALSGKPEQFETYVEALKMWFLISVYSPQKEYFVAIFDVITERKQTEEDLRKSEERFRSLYENATIGMYRTSPSGEIFLANPALVKMLGYSSFEALTRGRNLEQEGYEPGYERSQFRRQIEQFGEVNGLESAWTKADGTVLYVHESARTVKSPVGEILYYEGTVEDFTERKRAEDALLASSQYNRRLIEASLDPLVTIGPDGKITDVNSATEKVTGFSRTELIGTDFSDYFTEPERANAGYKEVFKEGFVQDYPLDIRHRDRHVTSVLYNASLYRDVNGKVLGVFAAARDITERKQSREALQKAHDDLEFQVQQRTAALSESNMLLQTLLDNMPDQIYFKDAESRFIKNSKAQATALGLSEPSQAVGKTDFDFFPHAQHSYEQEQEIIHSGKSQVDFEEHVVWPDGHETWVSTTKVPLRDHENTIIGTMGISRDITDRKRNEEALQKARDELEAFSYSVSHDLRAPLRGIDGWSLALLEDYGGQLDDQGREFIQRVRSETQHMGELIDDLLQLSRITRAEMHSERVDLSALARSIVARLQESEPNRKVEFIVQNDLSAMGDAHLLDVVLTNLLNNAFKFTGKVPDAHIEFGAMKIKNARVFFVRDNGAGFDMTFAKKLFGVFQRMHKASEFAGTGIGLATVQRIINRHGGRIWAESVVNQGATFFFTL